MKNNLIKKITFAIIGVIAFFLFWHISSVNLNQKFLPTPYASFVAFFNLVSSGDIIEHFLISSWRVFISLVLSLVLAVPFGLVLGRNQKLDDVFSPIIYLIYPLPKVVFLPVIVVLMGLGDAPKIFLITLVIYFQILVVTRDAAKSVTIESLNSIRSLNPSKFQIYRHLIVPHCMPQILTSLRITLGTAIAILFFSETFASINGLGYYILKMMDMRDYASMYGAIIAMAILGLIFYAVIDILENIICKWKKV